MHVNLHCRVLSSYLASGRKVHCPNLFRILPLRAIVHHNVSRIQGIAHSDETEKDLVPNEIRQGIRNGSDDWTEVLLGGKTCSRDRRDFTPGIWDIQCIEMVMGIVRLLIHRLRWVTQ